MMKVEDDMKTLTIKRKLQCPSCGYVPQNEEIRCKGKIPIKGIESNYPFSVVVNILKKLGFEEGLFSSGVLVKNHEIGEKKNERL